MPLISGPQSFQSANVASSSLWVEGLLSLFSLWCQWWLEGLGHAWALPEQEELSQQPWRKWCLPNMGTVCPCLLQGDRSLPHTEAAGDTSQTLCELVAHWAVLGGALFQHFDAEKFWERETSIKEEILLVFSEPLSGTMQERSSMKFTHIFCHNYFVRNEENPKSSSVGSWS